MCLNQSFISDFSEYSRYLNGPKIKYKLHYGWSRGKRFTAAILHKLQTFFVFAFMPYKT